MATAVAGSSGAAEADDDGALRGRAASASCRAGSLCLSQITASDVSTWVRGLADEGLASATVRNATAFSLSLSLSLVLSAAVRDGRLMPNVAEGVPLPRVVGEAQVLPHP
jgi:hypothetical protein